MIGILANENVSVSDLLDAVTILDEIHISRHNHILMSLQDVYALAKTSKFNKHLYRLRGDRQIIYYPEQPVQSISWQFYKEQLTACGEGKIIDRFRLGEAM